MAPTSPRLVADRYELRSVLGRGGAGAVWLAYDVVLGREVAVKEVDLTANVPEEATRVARARVVREARAAARLSHPNAVTVFDVVQEDGSAYIVMQLVRAPTLGELVEREGPLRPERAAAIGLQILGALEAAHAAGIVHRDVKPGNVMVREGDDAMLADFGIASLADDPSITATGVVIGSPSYMAPEQAYGQPAGPPVDLWGLGATLWFATEGRAPFSRGDPLTTLHAVVSTEPDPPRQAGPLTVLLLALLRKDPAKRPRSSEVARTLRRIASPTAAPVAVPPEPPSAEARTEPDRSDRRPIGRRWPLVAGLLGLLLLAGVMIPALLRGGGDTPPQEGAASRDDATAGSPPAEEQGPEPEPQDDETEGGVPDETGTPGAPPSPEQSAVRVPDGWVSYTDPDVGYSIAHPPGWSIVDRSDTITDFRDPNSGTYLRVDWTDQPPPTPESSWQELSAAFADGRESYEEIGITPTTWRGYDAALWEYRYTEGGARLHAANLGIDTGTYGYALNFQTREEDWEASQGLYADFQAAFQPRTAP